MTTARELAARLTQLAARVEHLCVNRRDPEVFHAEKSDIAWWLRRAAGDAIALAAPAPREHTTTWRPPYDV